MKSEKLCIRCEWNPAVINFCNDCARAVNRLRNDRDHLMEQARAARCVADATRDKQLEVFAAIQIFNPEIPTRRALEIARGVPKSRSF